MATAVGWIEGAPPGGRLRRGAGGRRATLVRAGLFGCSLVVAALALAAALVPPAPPAAVPAASDDAPAPAWVVIDRPQPMFSVAGSPYARLRLDYQARRRPDGSARQDTLTFGDFATAAPYLKLSLEWGRSPADAVPDLVVTAARLAGTAGIALLRAGQPDALPSRFGLVAVAPVTLGTGGDEKPCLAFLLEGRVALRIAGLACGGQGRGPARADLACALDRLDLALNGGEAALRAVFAAERRRDACTAAQGRS